MGLGKDGHIKLVQLVDDNGVVVGIIGVATPNRPSFMTAQKNVAVAGTAVNLAAQAIPNDFAVVIKAKKANTGTIRVGTSAANAQNSAIAFTLIANEKLTLYITDTNLIWIDATVSGEGVEIMVET